MELTLIILAFFIGVFAGFGLALSQFCNGYVEQKARNAWAIRRAKEGL